MSSTGVDIEVKQGSWVEYGQMQSGEPLYWNVWLVFDNGTITGQRFGRDEKLEYRQIAKSQYILVTNKELCKKLTREFVGAETNNNNP